MNTSIDDSAKVRDSKVGVGVKIFRCAEASKSELGDHSIVGNESILIESLIEDRVSINRRNYVLRSSVGRMSYTGIGTSIRSARVGRFCSISWNVSIGGGDHYFDRATTSPLWRLNMMNQDKIDHSSNKVLQERFDELPACIVGNDVWIATNPVILRDIKIGNGAIIGANAVVRKDVEPYTIVAGVPAKVVRKRFEDEIAIALDDLQWWDWPIEEIYKDADLIYSKKVDMNVIQQLRELKPV